MAIDFDKGFVAFPRGLTAWEWYDDINTSRVFFHLMLTANWEAKNWHGTVIDAGGQVTSIGRLAQAVGLSPKCVRTALNHLTATGYLTIKTTSKFSVITINNWRVVTGLDRLDGKRAAAGNAPNDKKTQDAGKVKGKQKADNLSDDTFENRNFAETWANKRANKGQTEGKQRATTKQLKQLKQEIEREGEREHAAAPPSPPDSESATRRKYGPYNNVLLTDEEMQALAREFPGDYQRRIDRLSEYMASNGKSYANHLATIRSWARRDGQQAKQGANVRAGKGVTRDPSEARDFLADAADRPRRLKRKG